MFSLFKDFKIVKKIVTKASSMSIVPVLNKPKEVLLRVAFHRPTPERLIRFSKVD